VTLREENESISLVLLTPSASGDRRALKVSAEKMGVPQWQVESFRPRQVPR
jgi:hypothetical protein